MSGVALSTISTAVFGAAPRGSSASSGPADAFGDVLDQLQAGPPSSDAQAPDDLPDRAARTAGADTPTRSAPSSAGTDPFAAFSTMPALAAQNDGSVSPRAHAGAALIATFMSWPTPVGGGGFASGADESEMPPPAASGDADKSQGALPIGDAAPDSGTGDDMPAIEDGPAGTTKAADDDTDPSAPSASAMLPLPVPPPVAAPIAVATPVSDSGSEHPTAETTLPSGSPGATAPRAQNQVATPRLTPGRQTSIQSDSPPSDADAAQRTLAKTATPESAGSSRLPVQVATPHPVTEPTTPIQGASTPSGAGAAQGSGAQTAKPDSAMTSASQSTIEAQPLPQPPQAAFPQAAPRAVSPQAAPRPAPSSAPVASPDIARVATAASGTEQDPLRSRDGHMNSGAPDSDQSVEAASQPGSASTQDAAASPAPATPITTAQPSSAEPPAAAGAALQQPQSTAVSPHPRVSASSDDPVTTAATSHSATAAKSATATKSAAPTDHESDPDRHEPEPETAPIAPTSDTPAVSSPVTSAAAPPVAEPPAAASQVAAALQSLAPAPSPAGALPRTPAVHASAITAAPTGAEKPDGTAQPAVRSMTIQLSPDHLGPVSITLRMSGSRVDVQIEVRSADALQALERDRHVLTAAIEAVGGEHAELKLSPTVADNQPGAAPADQAPSRQAQAGDGSASGSSAGGNAHRGQQSRSFTPSGLPVDDDPTSSPASRNRLDGSLYV